MSIDIPVLDGEEWWSSQAIDDTDSVIRSLLELTNSCIELKIKVEDAKQLHVELSLYNATHNIEFETNKMVKDSHFGEIGHKFIAKNILNYIKHNTYIKEKGD